MMTLEQRFPGRRALITGATSGYGEALAFALAARGWKIAVTGRQHAGVTRTVEEVNRLGGTGLGLLLEVREESQWDSARQALVQHWGGIDLLVNNAGIADSNKITEISSSDWADLMSTNLHGVINGCRAFIAGMSAQGGGHILNVASAAGLLCMPEMANYNVSKAGVVALSETLRAELSGAQIGVTVLCPSAFKSCLLDNALREGRDMGSASAIGRFLKRDMERGKHTSQSVAAHVLKDIRQGKLYSIPQPLYGLAWLLKRIAPNTFYQVVGWMYRRRLGLFAA
jgi:NADP-dependent 3-hydroxy acid dehydrogenase YdfG